MTRFAERNHSVRRVAWLCGLAVLGCASGSKPPSSPPGGDSKVQPAPGEQDQRLLADLEAEATGDAADHAPAPVPADRPPHTIYRSEIDRALARGPAYLLRQFDPEPFRHQGHFVGWEIGAVFPDDPALCAPGCGVEVGDVILSVGGDRLETPQAFTNFLEKLPRLQELEVRSLRNGERRVVTYRIVDDG